MGLEDPLYKEIKVMKRQKGWVGYGHLKKDFSWVAERMRDETANTHFPPLLGLYCDE